MGQESIQLKKDASLSKEEIKQLKKFKNSADIFQGEWKEMKNI